MQFSHTVSLNAYKFISQLFCPVDLHQVPDFNVTL